MPKTVPTDAQLIARVRDGADEAYDTLHRRHRDAAIRLADSLGMSPPDADTLVDSAFDLIRPAIARGDGPTDSFLAHLLTTVWQLADQHGEDTPPHDASGRWAGASTPLIRASFDELPQRWRHVLWRVDIEHESPAVVAVELGLTPNAVAALAYRAREGLRIAYLRHHLDRPATAECRRNAEQLAVWARGSHGRRDSVGLKQHLSQCDECQGLADRFAGMDSELDTLLLAPTRTGWSGYAGAGIHRVTSPGGRWFRRLFHRRLSAPTPQVRSE